MSEWRGDPAMGCGLMLLGAFVVAAFAAGLLLAWIVSVIMP
jgi:hypothetical protein